MREVLPQRANGHAISRDLNPGLVTLANLSPLGRETRKHPSYQIKKLARSIDEFGLVLPIVIDPAGRVISGWALVLAARQLGLTEIPAVTLTDLSEVQLRVLRQALNRLAEDSTWDFRELALEFADVLLIDAEFDLTLSGFEMGEIDVRLNAGGSDEEDEIPAVICGNALEEKDYRHLLGDEQAEMMMADLPYNVPIPGHASGLGKTLHEDFQMASGEMSPEEFTTFLTSALSLSARFSKDGSIHFAFMDWRHQKEILTAGATVYQELKNLVVWNKSNAGMGSLYRSKHELVYVFKKGREPHINNICSELLKMSGLCSR